MLTEAETALATLPTERTRDVSLYAELAARRGDFDIALARLAGGTGALARALRGWLFVQTGRFPDAVRELRQASQISASPSTLVNLGYAYAARGSLRKAVRATETAVGLAGGEIGAVACFNLAGYFLAMGDASHARSVLDRLERRRPHDRRINLARALISGWEGDTRGSLRELRRARSSHDYWANPDQRAEIEADIAFVEARIGKLAKADALKVLRQQLEKTSYRSLGIANLIGSLSWRRSDAKSLRALYEVLRRTHAAGELLELEAVLCLLEGEHLPRRRCRRRVGTTPPVG